MSDYLVDFNTASSGIMVYRIVFLILTIVVIFSIINAKQNRNDYNINSFFYYKFKKYFESLLKKSQKSSFLYIYLHNEQGDYAKEETISFLSRRLCERYFLLKYVKVFHIESQTIVLAFKDNSIVQDIIDDLKEYLSDSQKEFSNYSKINTTIVYVDDIHLAESFDDLTVLLKNYRLKSAENGISTNIIYFNQEIVDAIREEIKMSEEIEYAVNNGGVEILLQPVYFANEHKYKAAEIFMRLKDHNGKVIKPDKFIPVAIKYNKMSLLNVDIARQVLEFYELLESNGIKFDYISINASGFELENADYANSLLDTIKNSNVSPEKICIEVNDLETIKIKSKFVTYLNSIRMFGCRIAISGFGRTNSRLSNITELKAEFVKLDLSIVKKACEDNKAEIVLKDFIALMNDYEMSAMAVGVETEEEANKMISLGINYLQGKYYCDVLNKKEFLKFIKNSEEH